MQNKRNKFKTKKENRKKTKETAFCVSPICFPFNFGDFHFFYSLILFFTVMKVEDGGPHTRLEFE